MTRHLVILQQGTFLGVRGSLLVLRDTDKIAIELPLSRLGTVTVAKTGVAISSDFIREAAARGIRLFFLDFRGAVIASLSGTAQHATVAVRRAQLGMAESRRHMLSRAFVVGKIGNQRAVLLYFAKHHEKGQSGQLTIAAVRLHALRLAARQLNFNPQWQSQLFGIEGEAASLYFGALRQAGLLPKSFTHREGRGSGEITNAAFNLGYSILLARVWSCLVNAGLECYAGIYHTDRPGKPSLVLDAMEEHRPFVVDRAVVAMRSQLEADPGFGPEVRKNLIARLHDALDRRILHRGRKLRVETIIQRQAYRLAGAICGGSAYRPVQYPW